MNSAYAFAALAFACVSTPVAAQTSTYSGGTPVEGFPGDPVLGGAMKEYRAPAERQPLPGRAIGPGEDYGYGSSYPRPGNVVNFSEDTPLDASLLPPPAPRSELMVQSRNGVNWLCGGVGNQEQAYMKSVASRYDMTLTFAARNGAYLADVGVSIVGDNGRVLLQTQCDAPIMLVDLPQGGRYRIRAQADNYEVARTVQIQENPQRPRQVVMTWPVPEVDIQRNYSSGDIGDTSGYSAGRMGSR